MVHLDETDLEIIRRLWDGRASYADISRDMETNTKTVAKRARQMTESRAADITCLTDPFRLQGHGAAFVGFRIMPDKRLAALAVVDDLRGVLMSAIVTGRFDIMAIIGFNESSTYDAFIENEVHKVPGIKDIETFIAFGSRNFQLRYLLD